MTIPEIILILLGAAGVLLLAARLGMACLAAQRGYERQSRYETGTSKTIGDREVQEDEFGILESDEGIMAVLADGMGKAFGGKIAARIAVQTFLDVFEDRSTFYKPQYSLRKAFQGANREILNRLEDEQGSACVAAVVIQNRRLYYAAAGNVQAAVFRSHELTPVTSGHTISVLARQKYEEGKLTREEAVSLLDRHRLYNFVGQDGFREIEFFDTPIILHGGEYILLMSDGLYETVRWKDIEDCLDGNGSCQEKAYRIIELVNRSDQEAKDNGAVVIIRC